MSAFKGIFQGFVLLFGLKWSCVDLLSIKHAEQAFIQGDVSDNKATSSTEASSLDKH